jgi:hypothetical protein
MRAPVEREAHATLSWSVTKQISFSILEDYEKGDRLDDVAKDFRLMNELGIDVLRCSFGWDDYEPAPRHYDFAWLRDFVRLAATHGIKLRPYIGYTPRWAGRAGSADGVAWNNPPADYRDWYRFVYRLAEALREYPNVLSYEIYNEQNVREWWDGSIEEYMAALRVGALAIRAGHPEAQILLGGLVFPDHEWLRTLVEDGHARYYDITSFHAYPETWTAHDVVVENYLNADYRVFVNHNRILGEAEPIWINEMGFAATPDKSEAEQANWWARAVSTFAADPDIEHIGIYEIKDLPPYKEAIGDTKNYHLGITRADRTKKLAFHTLTLLNDLLAGVVTVAGNEASVIVIRGEAKELYWRLFKRPSGKQVLFVYDKAASPTVNVTLRIPGSTASRYELNGTATPHADFDGRVLRGIQLRRGEVAIFRIDP